MYSITQFSKLSGLGDSTLRTLEKNGTLVPEARTLGGHRRYSKKQLEDVLNFDRPRTKKAIGYCRVSTEGQKDDLQRQRSLLETHLATKDIPFEIIEDIGSGVNYNKKGLLNLITQITGGGVSYIAILHKDRLLRFGFELMEHLCDIHGTDLHVMTCGEEKTVEEEMVEDVLNILHVYSCRLNGRRSGLNRKIKESL